MRTRKQTTYVSPLWETIINKAIFLNEDIIVYPRAEDIPNNFDRVVKFLFGEGATVVEDFTNGCPNIIIRGANFELRNAHTVNADWVHREVEV